MLISSGVACVISMLINILLAKQYGVGSAVIGYFVYVVIVIGLYYGIYYSKIIKLKRLEMLKSFLLPTLLAFLVLLIIWNIPFPSLKTNIGERFDWIIICIAKSLLWLLPYILVLLLTKTLDYKEVKGLLKYKN